MIQYGECNEIDVRVEVLRSGGVISQLIPYDAPRVTCAASSRLKMCMSGTFLMPESGDADTEKNAPWSVSTTDGVTGFAYDADNDCWIAQNTEVGVASYALARIDVTTPVDAVLTLRGWMHGTDYNTAGAIYAVDVIPESDAQLSDDVPERFVALKNDYKDVAVEIQAGTHFVYAKSVRNSVSSESTTFRFAVVSLKDADGNDVSGTSTSNEIQWMSDRIRPVLLINGDEYPVGQFVATTVETRGTAAAQMISLEAYSLLYLADRVSPPSGYTIEAGTNYIAAVQELLRYAGIVRYEADETDAILASARADWPEGTSVLDIVNALLAETNYNDAWVDLDGVVRLTAYVPPGQTLPRHTYNVGRDSIISAEYTLQTDFFEKANVFRCIADSPDTAETLVAEAVNDIATSPYSVANVGARIVHTEHVEGTPDEEALRQRAERLLTESLQTEERVSFTTALDPTHGMYDTVAIGLDDVRGLFRETEWSMTLDASGVMTHVAERVVTR